MSRLFLFAAITLVPTIAYAAAGGEQSVAALVLNAVGIAVQTYVASEIHSIKRRQKKADERQTRTEQRLQAHLNGEIAS